MTFGWTTAFETWPEIGSKIPIFDCCCSYSVLKMRRVRARV